MMILQPAEETITLSMRETSGHLRKRVSPGLGFSIISHVQSLSLTRNICRNVFAKYYFSFPK